MHSRYSLIHERYYSFPMRTFQTGMGLKTSTSLVRCAYIQAMLACFNPTTIAQANVLTPILLKSVEKAVAQSTQAPIVTEGLCAAYMLLKILTGEGEKANNLQSFWNSLFDMEKQVFLSEKFLSVASDDGLLHVMYLCEKLLLEYSERLNGNIAPLHRAVLYCTIVSPTSVRLKCLPILKKIVGSLGGTQIARALFRELLVFLEVTRLQVKSEKEAKEESREISSHATAECVIALCSASTLSMEDAQLVCIDALFVCHHPLVVAAAPNLWVKIVKRHGLSPKDFVVQQRSYFRKNLIEGYKVNQVKCALNSSL